MRRSDQRILLLADICGQSMRGDRLVPVTVIHGCELVSECGATENPRKTSHDEKRERRGPTQTRENSATSRMVDWVLQGFVWSGRRDSNPALNHTFPSKFGQGATMGPIAPPLP
jgi:hypothetical protein